MQKKIIVNDLEESIRIDQYLAKIEDLDFTRAKLQRLISNDLILVNGKKIKNSYKVVNGDVISITDEERVSDIKPEKMDIDIVYEDDDLLVVNKESGVVVHPAPGNYSHTLVNGLLYNRELSTINGSFRPGVVHRIDKDTSGLIIIAKNDLSHINLSRTNTK